MGLGILSASVSVLAEQEPGLGPGCFTYPQIARWLSRDGHTVTCDASLHNRAALIYFKPRSRDAACKLLAAGLDIRLRSDGGTPGTEILEPDPDVTIREQRWFSRYSRSLNDRLQAKLAALTPYIGITDKQLQQRSDALTGQLAAMRRSRAPEQPSSRQELDLNAQLTALKEVTGSYPQIVQAGLLLKQAVRSWEPAFSTGTSLSIAPIPATLAASVAERRSNQPAPVCVSGWVLDPVHGNALFKIFFGSANDIHEYNGGVLSLDPPPDVYRIFHGMGEKGSSAYRGLESDAATWLAAERDKTKQFLAIDIAQRPIDVPRAADSATLSLSQVIESWSRSTDAEVVMELCPPREVMIYPNVLPMSSMPQGGFGRTISASSLAGMFGEEGGSVPTLTAWSAWQQDGVTLLKDRLAFIDRRATYPLPTLLDLEAHPWRTVDATVPYFTLRQLMRYADYTPEQQDAICSLPGDLKTYRGLDLPSLALAAPIATAWRQLTANERAQILKQAASGSPATYPLSALAPGSLGRVLERMQANPLDYPESLVPGFGNLLAHETLTVTVETRADLGGVRLATLSMLPSSGTPFSLPQRLVRAVVEGSGGNQRE
jgi:hypothetical protein